MKFMFGTLSRRSLNQCSTSLIPQLRPQLRIPTLTPTTTTTTTTNFSTFTMGHPQPQRKAPTGRRGGHHPYRGNRKPAASPAQQPNRPTIDAEMSDAPGVMDPRRLYSTAHGGEGAKEYASLAGKLDPALLEGLDRMGFKYMSPVQQKVLSELPSLTSDCLVQAKTGTGKTAAFLLPAIQSILEGNAPPRGKIGILIICPTRELALQIAKEADGITACLPPNKKMECHTAFGGTARASALNKLMRGNPMILVATPGRLGDILGEEEVREKFSHIKTLVLDEADRMLDAGFAPDVHKILRKLPPKSDGWQGMCFSATLPANVKDVVKCALLPDYTSLSTVDHNETPTVDRVPQFSVMVPSVGQTFAALLALIETEYKASPEEFKAIVFGTTANGVGLLYDLYRQVFPQFKVFELHSRLSQPARTRTTEEFKNAKSGILFASDVVGRGMDFPNVGLVVQLGLPSAQDQYIHRVGRTARAGRDGRAVTILFENESFFVKVNPSLPIKPYPQNITADLGAYQQRIDCALVNVEEESKQKAYQAFLGYNKTYLKKLRLDTKGLVQIANQYAQAMGCPEPPPIQKSTIGKMGLKGVPGLNIVNTRR